MKKFLCVFLSLVLAFSVVTVAFAADDEGINLAQTLADKIADDNFINAFNGKTLEFNSAELNQAPYYVGGKYDVTKIINNGKINQVEFLGLNLGQVYSSQTDVLDWAQLSVSYSDVANLWGALNQYINEHLDRDKEDFELEVGSAGLTAPLRTLRQYAKFEGETMEVMLRDGRKLRGILGATDDEGFDLTWTTLEHVIDPATGKRSKKKQEVEHHEHLSHKDVNRIYYNF